MLDILPRLHDATLLSIKLDWAEKVCTFDFVGAPSIPHAFSLVWSDVQELVIPRKDEWGPSVSVMSAKNCGDNRYEIQMQSGDTIVIVSPALAAHGVT